MAFFIHPNQFLIFFSDPSKAFNAAKLKEALDATGVSMKGKAEPFALQCGKGPILYASIIHGETASMLAGRLLGRSRNRIHKALAAASDAYIEIKFESLDEVLDEINTMIDVQSALQAATGGLMYRSWNQSFSAPDE